MKCENYLDTVNKRDGELFEKNMDSAMVEFLENEINKPVEQSYTKKNNSLEIMKIEWNKCQDNDLQIFVQNKNDKKIGRTKVLYYLVFRY